MKALAYGLSFASSCIATAILAAPMPYIAQNKEEVAQLLQRYAIDKQGLELNHRSYNNPALMALTGVLGLVSFGLMVKELSDKPLIESPVQVQTSQAPSASFVNNNKFEIHNVANTRSPQVQTQTKQEYTPDISETDNSNPYAWLKQIYGTNCVLMFGGQGSGKTSFVEWYAEEKTKQGDEVIVFDVHRKYGAWKGLRVVGDGRNYKAIDEEILRMEKLITTRYQQFATEEFFNPRPITLIFEEFSKWKNFCEHSDSFFLTALTDIRKVLIQVVFVSHVKTMSGLTNQKGLLETFNSGVDKLELISEKIECTDGIIRPRPTGKGRLTLVNSSKPILVDIPSYDAKLAALQPNYLATQENDKVIDLDKRRTA